eukprot:3365153-Pyramimonas_sp.AAC.1
MAAGRLAGELLLTVSQRRAVGDSDEPLALRRKPLAFFPRSAVCSPFLSLAQVAAATPSQSDAVADGSQSVCSQSLSLTQLQLVEAARVLTSASLRRILGGPKCYGWALTKPTKCNPVRPISG